MTPLLLAGLLSAATCPPVQVEPPAEYTPPETLYISYLLLTSAGEHALAHTVRNALDAALDELRSPDGKVAFDGTRRVHSRDFERIAEESLAQIEKIEAQLALRHTLSDAQLAALSEQLAKHRERARVYLEGQDELIRGLNADVTLSVTRLPDGRSLQLIRRADQDIEVEERYSRTIPIAELSAGSRALASALHELFPELNDPPQALLTATQDAGFGIIRAEEGAMKVAPGVPVQFDAAGSRDQETPQDALSFSWQLEGELASWDGPRLSFTFPAVDEETTHCMTLTVDDGARQRSDRVEITVSPSVTLSSRTLPMQPLGVPVVERSGRLRAHRTPRPIDLFVEPSELSQDATYHWRVDEGSAPLRCHNILNADTCTDADGLSAATALPYLQIATIRPGGYRLRVHHVDEDIPSAPIRVDTEAVFLRNTLSIGPSWSAVMGFHAIEEVNQPSIILEWGSEWLQGRVGGIMSAELFGQEVYTGGPLAGLSVDWTDMVVSITERARRGYTPRSRISIAQEVMFDIQTNVQAATFVGSGVFLFVNGGPEVTWRNNSLMLMVVARSPIQTYSPDVGLGLEFAFHGDSPFSRGRSSSSRQAIYEAHQLLSERRQRMGQCVEARRGGAGTMFDCQRTGTVLVTGGNPEEPGGDWRLTEESEEGSWTLEGTLPEPKNRTPKLWVLSAVQEWLLEQDRDSLFNAGLGGDESADADAQPIFIQKNGWENIAEVQVDEPDDGTYWFSITLYQQTRPSDRELAQLLSLLTDGIEVVR